MKYRDNELMTLVEELRTAIIVNINENGDIPEQYIADEMDEITEYLKERNRI